MTIADFGIRGVHLAYELLDGYDALVLDRRHAAGRAARHGRRSFEPDIDVGRSGRCRRPLDEPGGRARPAARAWVAMCHGSWSSAASH